MSESQPASANRAVFLSYASQDAEAVERIAVALRAAGVEVWFDKDELVGGDAWDQKIRRQIKECALFVPVISAATQARTEGYFRLEWRLADHRTHLMAKGRPFLVPIVIDETRDAEAQVPDSFTEVQWTRLPGGEAPPQFCERVKLLLAARPEKTASATESHPGHGRPAPIGVAAPLPRKHSSLAVGGVVLAVMMAIAAAVFVSRRPTPLVAGPAQPVTTATPAITPPPPPASVALDASEKSVVVLPFESLSSDLSNAAFVEGMHAETIGALATLGDVKIISRNSALALKGTTLSLAEIGKKLGVANVITGTVRREGDRVRIQLELRRASDEAVLWTKFFEKQVTDVFAIQNDIATEVARVLQARDRRGTMAGSQFMTKDPRVYELFVRLRREYDAATPTGLPKDFFQRLEELVQADPQFMPAVSLLSSSHTRRFNREYSDADANSRHAEEARRWAEIASKLMPGGAGDGALAYYHNNVTRDYARALVFAQNTMRALPNDATGYNFAALALFGQGRIGDAIASLDKALELDPLNSLFQNNRMGYLVAARRHEAYELAVRHWKATHDNSPPPDDANRRFALYGELSPQDLGEPAKATPTGLYRARRFPEALAAIEEQLAGANLTDAQRSARQSFRSRVLRRLGRKNEAAEAAQFALASAEKLPGPNDIDMNENFLRTAAAQAQLGRTDEAVALMRRIIEAARLAGQIRLERQREITLAQILGEAGRTRECVDLVAKLLRVPSGLSVPMLKVDPIWDNVREDAGFKALLVDPKNSAPL